MKIIIALVSTMTGISSAFASTYQCTFDLQNSGGKLHADYVFDSNTVGGTGMDLGGVSFKVYKDSIHEKDTIALTITSSGGTVGTISPLGTPWVYLIDNSAGAQIYCKI